MANEISDAIDTSAQEGLKKATGDSGSVERYSLTEQIEADRYLAGKTAVSNQRPGFKLTKIIPPGAS